MKSLVGHNEALSSLLACVVTNQGTVQLSVCVLLLVEKEMVVWWSGVELMSHGIQRRRCWICQTHVRNRVSTTDIAKRSKQAIIKTAPDSNEKSCGYSDMEKRIRHLSLNNFLADRISCFQSCLNVLSLRQRQCLVPKFVKSILVFIRSKCNRKAGIYLKLTLFPDLIMQNKEFCSIHEFQEKKNL